MFVRVSLRGILKQIRVDTLRRVHNDGFLEERLSWNCCHSHMYQKKTRIMDGLIFYQMYWFSFFFRGISDSLHILPHHVRSTDVLP